jgi:hypothetical protein
MTARSIALALLLSVATVLLTGCDSGGNGGSIVLNANSPVPPTIQYSFTYSSDDANDDGVVEVISSEADALDNVFRQNGVSRSSVVRARIDSVELERQSTTGPSATPKVFRYLAGAEVFLGSDASAPRIAARQFQTTDRTVTLNVQIADVTSVVQAGSTPALLRLTANSPDDIPLLERVRLTVFYTIEFNE